MNSQHAKSKLTDQSKHQSKHAAAFDTSNMMTGEASATTPKHEPVEMAERTAFASFHQLMQEQCLYHAQHAHAHAL